MQPSPRADTSKLLFPSLRFCIVSPYKSNWSRLRCCPCTLFAPSSRWNSFPSAESANEGVSVLVPEKVGGFIQLEARVIKIVASELVTGFFENALKTGLFVLQTSLQGAGAGVQGIGDVLDGGAAASESLLYRYTDAFDKVLVPVFLLQLFIKLRCKYSQKLGVTRDERAIGVGSTKNDSVARSSADDRAAEVTLDSPHVGTRLYELHANRRNTRPCADASGREHPGKAAFDKNRRLDLVSEKPAELNAPLFVVLFLEDLFRAGELLIASHLIYG